MSGQTLTKRCPSPLHVGERNLPITEFHLCASKKDGRKAWCRYCIAAKNRLDPSKQKARSDRWSEKNRELSRQRARTYYAANTEKVKASQRQRSANATPEQREKWNKAGREFYARNRERLLVKSRRIQREKRPYYRAALVRYRARKKAAGGNVTESKMQARWDYFAGKCWMCGDEAEEMDHVKPVSKGGGSWASNLRPACKPCNRRKHATWPFPTNLDGLFLSQGVR